uniref:F-box domain-containing protein n=1 Tax=Oryza nivara TaxID=4536 RepID=A0A0E0I1N5_ORYNI
MANMQSWRRREFKQEHIQWCTNKKLHSILDIKGNKDWFAFQLSRPTSSTGQREAERQESLPNKRRNPAASLTDELIVEILRRLPIRSVCQFKCVSKSWRRLIADHEHRKKLPQTLSGFFYKSINYERCQSTARHFTNVTGKGMPLVCPSFSFLPQCHDVYLLDCCNGLLLCRCYVSRETLQFHYAVCNPATKEWVMLPDASWAIDENRTACLCFDPAISSHFHMLEYVEEEDDSYVTLVTGVEIYSSETGLWTLHENGWNDEVVVSLSVNRRSVFLNGFLHSVTPADEIVAVDMEGKKWRKIPMLDPDGDIGIIHQTQGRMCAFNVDPNDIFKLSIWFLEDYDTDNWILKHTVSSMKLFGGKKYQLDYDYQVIAVHPECNLIFFVYGWHNTLMAYEMDRKEVRAIRKLGHESRQPYLPYVPMFSESLADGR